MSDAARSSGFVAPEAHARPPVLVAREVSKRRAAGPFGLGRQATILSRVSIDLHAGELTLLGGDGGSGKSTLLRLLSLNDRPSEGTVSVFGRDTTRMSGASRDAVKAAHIHLIPQTHFGIMPRTAMENVAHWLIRFDGCSPAAATAAAAEALRFVQLGEDKFGRRVDRGFAGSERARVAIATALARGRGICLADEPFAPLPEKRALELICLFRALADQGAAVVVIVHEPMLTKLEPFFDRVVILDKGTLVRDAPTIAPEPCPRLLFSHRSCAAQQPEPDETVRLLNDLTFGHGEPVKRFLDDLWKP